MSFPPLASSMSFVSFASVSKERAMLRFAIALLAFVCAAAFAHGADWYVSPKGQPGNEGTKDSPWSLAAAVYFYQIVLDSCL